MTDELGLRREINRAERAKALLEDPMLVEAFNVLQAEYRKLWEESAPSATADREKTYLALKMLPVLRRNLEAVMRDGRVAALQLTNLELDAARAKQQQGRRR